MGRLSGFKYRDVARRLRSMGFEFDRPGPGSHEVWRHTISGRKVTLPHRTRSCAPNGFTACSAYVVPKNTNESRIKIALYIPGFSPNVDDE